MINKLLSRFIVPILLFFSTFSFSASAVELVIGEAREHPGIVFIFEGAVKDTVSPPLMHLKEAETDIHIEARVNWAETNIPEGTPPGGFVAGMKIFAVVKNQRTGLKSAIDLIQHINLIDNLHYARNMMLPGSIDDLYEVTFFVTAPRPGFNLSFHKDWIQIYGNKLMNDKVFTYTNVNFGEIARASR